ncbi:MAG: hypothetical protein ACI94C_001407 [Sediminicola sp.]|jgi:hypothetical protein
MLVPHMSHDLYEGGQVLFKKTDEAEDWQKMNISYKIKAFRC